MKPTLKGFWAWLGVWVAGMMVGKELLHIEEFGWICCWGVFVYLTANSVEKWIETPAEKKDENRLQRK